MKNSARLNSDHSVIELSIEILSCPSLIKYLALPHEWNHSLINTENKELEEIITVMYDFMRISQLMLKDKLETQHLLRELEKLEEPYQGKKILLEAFRNIKAGVHEKKRFLSPFEFYDFTIDFIKSDPDLYTLTKDLLEKEDKEYFVNKFTATMKNTQYDIPPTLPGEQNYMIFDNATLGKAYTAAPVKSIMQMRPIYLSDSEFFERSSNLAESADLDFQDATGFFDPSMKEIGVNTSHYYHLNPDPVIAANFGYPKITHQTTHYLLHHNSEILDRLVDKINSDEEVLHTILRYFLVLKRSLIPCLSVLKEKSAAVASLREKEQLTQLLAEIHNGKIASDLSMEQLNSISKDQTYTTGGQINLYKIVNEVIAASNGLNTVISAYATYSDLKKKLKTECEPVPDSLADKVEKLQRVLFHPENILLFKLSDSAEKYITGRDERLADIFRIPHFSVVHVISVASTDVIESPSDDIQNTIEDREDISEDDTIVYREITQNIEPGYRSISPDFIGTEEFNEFLTVLRTVKQLPPKKPVYYNEEISWLNSREFFDYLLDLKDYRLTCSFPEEIIITDIYLGNPEHIKYFLDRFKELDVNNYFYSRLHYNIVSHSLSSKLLLNKLQQSNTLDEHTDVVSYKYFPTLIQAENTVKSAMLVRLFGDTSLFSNVVLIEKKDNSFFLITGQPKVNNAVTGRFSVQEFAELIKDPSAITETQINDLTPEIIDAIEWDARKVRIDIENLPFGSLLKKSTQNRVDEAFIFHPDLLHLIQRTLSNMKLNFGGYWQMNCNSFGSLPDQIVIPEETLKELDSTFLPAIIGEQSGFIFESQESYINRKTGAATTLFVIDELRKMNVQTLSAIFPPVTFSDINHTGRIFNILQNPIYKSADEFTFQRFIKNLKSNGLLPAKLTASLKTDPEGVNDFLHSLTVGFGAQIKWDKIANAIIETAHSTNSKTIDEFILEIMANSDIEDAHLSGDCFMRIYDDISAIVKDKKGFHLKLDVLAPERTESTATARNHLCKTVSQNAAVRIRKLNYNQINSYIELIKRDCPHLDYNDPRGIANPVAREIVINIDHRDHTNPDGSLNMPGYQQTVIHEKTHMLTFKYWEILTEIVHDMLGAAYYKDEIIKMFYRFYFEEIVDLVNQDRRYRLKIDPLWSSDNEISYERLISEILAVINQYAMLPTLMKRFVTIEKQLSMRGKTVPSFIAEGPRQINEILVRNKDIISSTIAIRHELHLIDQRLTRYFLFDKKIFNTPIVLQEFDSAFVPIPRIT